MAQDQGQKGWDKRYDVVVIGAGAAGFSAAIRAKLAGMSVLLIEKNGTFGGSTSRSGGAIWIPNNIYLKEAGVEDSYEKGRTYLAATVGSRTPQALQDAYLLRGAEMVQYFREHTHLQWRYVKGYSDYYPDLPGGESRGRTIEAELFDLSRLGEDLAKMGRSIMPTQGMVLTAAEFHKINMMRRTWAGKCALLKVGCRFLRDKISTYTPASLGEALIGRLFLSYKELGGELWLNAPFQSIVAEEGIAEDAARRVTGITLTYQGSIQRIKARCGVIFGSGGFSHNQALRERYLPQPTCSEWSLAANGQTGDLLFAAKPLGADFDLLEAMWGTPVAMLPKSGVYMPVAERALPGALIVDQQGERYLNEALPYHQFVDEVYAHHQDSASGESVPSWYLFDERMKNHFLLFGMLPGVPVAKSWVESGAIKIGETLEALAEAIEVETERLQATVIRFNEAAKRGIDEDFHKGESAYDRFYGDPTRKNPNLAPLSRGPFYALPLYPGDIGTKGGVKINASAQVLRKTGTPILGLYAAGNCSASVMGKSYPGAGATLGPAMTFGYIAATHIISERESQRVNKIQDPMLETPAVEYYGRYRRE